MIFDVISGGLKHFVLGDINIHLTKVLLQSLLIVMGTQAVQVPWLSRPKPEHVSSDGITEWDACAYWLHNIPREGNVGSILRKHELEHDNRYEGGSWAYWFEIASFLGLIHFVFYRFESPIDYLELLDQIFSFLVHAEAVLRHAVTEHHWNITVSQSLSVIAILLQSFSNEIEKFAARLSFSDSDAISFHSFLLKVNITGWEYRCLSSLRMCVDMVFCIAIDSKAEKWEVQNLLHLRTASISCATWAKEFYLFTPLDYVVLIQSLFDLLERKMRIKRNGLIRTMYSEQGRKASFLFFQDDEVVWIHCKLRRTLEATLTEYPKSWASHRSMSCKHHHLSLLIF